MAYKIEFFRITKAAPNGEVMSQVEHDFEDIKSAAYYGITNTGEKSGRSTADGFRIYVNGVLTRTVFIRVPETGPHLR
jgi:hypothetical protein